MSSFTFSFLAQSSGSGILVLIIQLAVIALVIAGGWKAFVKAGQPGWAFIVPIYNIYIMLQMVGRPIWWLILMFIPFVNLVILIIVMIDVAKAYGKGAGFGLGLAFLGFIFWPILGFGDAQYQGKAVASGFPVMPPRA